MRLSCQMNDKKFIMLTGGVTYIRELKKININNNEMDIIQFGLKVYVGDEKNSSEIPGVIVENNKSYLYYSVTAFHNNAKNISQYVSVGSNLTIKGTTTERYKDSKIYYNLNVYSFEINKYPRHFTTDSQNSVSNIKNISDTNKNNIQNDNEDDAPF